MIQKTGIRKHQSVKSDSKRLNSRTAPARQNEQETGVYEDTAELVVQNAPQGSGSSKPPRAFKTKIPPKTAAKSPSPLHIHTPDSNEDSDELDVWEATYRGMPSWFSSLVIHLSLILALAFLTMGNNAKSIIDLTGTTNESVELETIETAEFVLKTEEIETINDEIQVTDSKLNENEDLSSLLEDALLSTRMDSDDGSLFESISDQGLSGGNASGKIGIAGTKFFGIDGTGKDFVFVIDCSGSMADYGRWRLAVRELKRSINQMNEDQRFLILLYNNGFIAMNDEAELVKSTEKERDRAMRWLARNYPDNWTFCAEALAKALTLKPDSIFLLSDGEFDDRQDVFFVLDSLNNNFRRSGTDNRQIPINTIALGSHLGRWTMKRIADENSGTYKLIE